LLPARQNNERLQPSGVAFVLLSRPNNCVKVVFVLRLRLVFFLILSLCVLVAVIGPVYEVSFVESKASVEGITVLWRKK
jgi:hypothetical protein